ncbi:MAG: NTPase [Eubacteriaceae bacterium]|nr:NTPase [Eubacteriaceae bacterium]
MEFKAPKIRIDSTEPYKDDKLSRKNNIDNLSLLLRNFSTPIVLSINAPWGNGKTTFMEMLHADLVNNSCDAIYFSAWETDFASDPLLAFLGEVNPSLEKLIDGDQLKEKAWAKAKKAGGYILKKGLPALIKVGTAGVIDCEAMTEEEVSKLMEGFSKDLIDSYGKNKNEIQSFKDCVSKVLTSENGEPKKMYILIDELDRCRPIYAIEFLERIKHLLDIKGLVFVLALDKEQLSHSVRALYGDDFEAIGYLRRFIDVEYTLPESSVDDFIDGLYEHFEFNSFFLERQQSLAFRYEKSHLINVFKMLSSAFRLSLRETEQIFSKMNLVLRSTKNTVYLYPSLLVFLLIVKELNLQLYKKYIKKESTPEEMIGYLYKFIQNQIYENSRECALVEGYLIAAKNSDYEKNLGQSLQKHIAFIKDENCGDKQKSYSNLVIEIANKPLSFGDSVLLSNLVSRIEMLERFEFA